DPSFGIKSPGAALSKTQSVVPQKTLCWVSKTGSSQRASILCIDSESRQKSSHSLNIRCLRQQPGRGKGRFLIAKAMLEFHKSCCIRFVPRTTETDYIEISPNGGCSSHIGRVGRAQSVTLGRGCYTVGIMVHELMHTLGFVHEQNRPDRDDYITVLWDNVKEGLEGNFVKLEPYAVQSLGEPYDYSSILHYSKFAFSKDSITKPTLEPKKRGCSVGQRKGLSAGDVRKINKLYNCGK
ncbi:zinc metalloproteinase nas-15, partial [Caerostris extrusa]